MPTLERVNATLQDAERLFQEKIEGLQGQVAQLEREKHAAQLEVDRRREEASKLDRSIKSAEEQLAALTDKVASGQAALEANRKKVLEALAKREAEANARIETAAGAEAKARQAQSAADSLRASCVGAKQDLLQELAEAQAGLAALAKKLAAKLEAIK